MDIQMESETSGISASKEIFKVHPNKKIIAFTIHENSDIISKAFKIGMVDYILKSASIEEIVTTIRDCATTDNYKRINSILAYEFENIKTDFLNLKVNQKKIMKCFSIIAKISKSESDILMSLCSGMNYSEIAKQRTVEEVTIRSMVNRITKKSGVNNIKDLIAKFNECDFFNTIYNNDDREE